MPTNLSGIFRCRERAAKYLFCRIKNASVDSNSSKCAGSGIPTLSGRVTVWRSYGTPEVSEDDRANTYPVKKGDFVFDDTNNNCYLCTVGVVSGVTNATFVKMVL